LSNVTKKGTRNLGDITSNPRLRQLLEDDDLDWDNPHHREMYLKEWVKAPREAEEDPADE